MTVATMPGLASRPSAMPTFGDDRHQLIAVDDMAPFIDDQHAVGVAVERDADVGAHLPHLSRERLRRGRADAAIDVEAVGFDADRKNLGAQFP